MTDEPIQRKTSPHYYSEIRRYGQGIQPVDTSRSTPPDLVVELENRGIEVGGPDAAQLQDETLWPADVRVALMAVVRAAEEAGVTYLIDYEHRDDTESVSLPRLTIALVGP